MKKIYKFQIKILLIPFLLFSCEKETVDTITDNTIEIDSPKLSLQYEVAKKPEEIQRTGERTDANGQKHSYTEYLYKLDDEGNAYEIGVVAESQLPLSTNISMIKKAEIIISMKKNDSNWEKITSLPLPYTITEKNDLNKDGIIQNNEKFFRINLSTKIGTSKISWSNVPGAPLSNNGYPLVNLDGSIRPDSEKIYGVSSMLSKLNDSQITKTDIIFLDEKSNIILKIQK